MKRLQIRYFQRNLYKVLKEEVPCIITRQVFKRRDENGKAIPEIEDIAVIMLYKPSLEGDIDKAEELRTMARVQPMPMNTPKPEPIIEAESRRGDESLVSQLANVVTDMKEEKRKSFFDKFKRTK